MSGTSYIRFRTGQDRRTEVARFNELHEGHPLVGELCFDCLHPLEVGQRPGLFAVGPTTIADGIKADAGHWYAALALVAHESCLWKATV